MVQLVPIREIAQKWLNEDNDPDTRKEIDTLLQKEDNAQLEKALRHRIAFGTAGLRAAMKAGYAYMNSLTVAQASQGLADYIISQQVNKKPLKIVIGYDGRHNSDKFARLAAAAFISKGIQVLWFGKLVHTPMVPFAVKHFDALAGVMVTASHNPKNDNGYKVYWSNGSQIIPPHDKGIASAIDAVDHILNWDTETVDHSALTTSIFDETLDHYLRSIITLASSRAPTSSMQFTYTPMHGVGLPFMQAAARIAGIEPHDFHVVQAQALPDPEFPTVPFPNPEEKGAMSLAMEEAEKNNTTIVLANDPDADRFSVAEKLPSGQWHQFTGNQIGVLLASHIYDVAQSSVQEPHQPSTPRLAMLASTVSSRMLSAIARSENFHFQETLTGFKWLGNIGQQLQSENYHVIFAYEEAIGFMFPSVVWDKDGVAAATAFITACRTWRARENLTPYQKLQTLYQKYGFFEDANTYLISPSPATTNRVFDDIRAHDRGRRPTSLGPRTIHRWRDLTTGFDTASPDNRPDLPVDSSAQMITCELDHVIFTIRGSGTEPKIKLYIEATADNSDDARAMAQDVLRDLLKEWFKPETNGLRLPSTSSS